MRSSACGFALVRLRSCENNPLRTELIKLVVIAAVFAGCFFLPVGQVRFDSAITESLHLVRDYAREHVLLCLVPAFFIAGAISVFISQASVMKYLGAKANKVLAYCVAGVSGTVLAVCSCTVLPLFAGIYRMGAGLGPATAFLYAGPAINVLAILLTARVLGWQLGVARVVGAVAFSVVIGLAMHVIFRKSEAVRAEAPAAALPDEHAPRALWKNATVLALMVLTLVFANWSVSGRLTVGISCCPAGSTISEYIQGEIVSETDSEIVLELRNGQTKRYPKNLIDSRQTAESPLYVAIHNARFYIAAATVLALAAALIAWFTRAELGRWTGASWDFAKQILPLLLAGVVVAGLLLGRSGPGQEGLIPRQWVELAVGGNSLRANFFASVAGAFMYFATLTEIPIVEGLRGAGMGDGPALALLLAGPALSLPNMIVIGSIIGTKRTLVYVLLVVVMATVSGIIYGAIA